MNTNSFNLRLRAHAIHFDGLFFKVDFRQDDGNLPSIGEQVLTVQFPSREMQFWVDAVQEKLVVHLQPNQPNEPKP